MQSLMDYKFSQVPSVDIPRSVFDRSHGYKTTFDSSYLVPFFVDEALPGDTFKAKTSIFARLATPAVPFMDNLFLDTFYFAVPCRLVWDNWQQFMGERLNPDDETDYLVPKLDIDAPLNNGTLYDYMGIPTGVSGFDINALPFRAYNLIYNEWFRDQNLIDRVTVDKGDGPDDVADYNVLKRGKRHDYFTSCLPWPQKGDAVTLPLGTNAPVIGNGISLGLEDGFGHQCTLGKNTPSGYIYPGWETGTMGEPIGTTITTVSGGTVANKTLGLHRDPNYSGAIADLSSATASTINALRQAFQLQRVLERDARGGTRYTELIRSHFGVISPDARMQRPEYLGGSSSRININPVQQTSASDAVTPQGNLAAYGLVSDQSGGFVKSFTEHSYIIGIACVRADLNYQQGLNKMFSRQTRYDFYLPALAHLGEQEVLSKEIYVDGSPADENVFGYQERWAEYRYHPSKITGKFRSNDPVTLDNWHLAQNFGSRPELNQNFIEENVPLDRVIAVQNEPQILFDSYINLNCARCMPTYSVPGLIDHF